MKQLLVPLLVITHASAALVADGAEPTRARRKTPAYELRVRGRWPGSNASTVERVCRSAADALMHHFPQRAFRPIVVEHRKTGGPRLFYEGGAKSRHTTEVVKLTAKGPFWAQLIYQFAHEHCHILHNADLPYPHEAAWFGETLSELASLFVLRRLAETWNTKPPFPGWQWYAKHLRGYADGIMRGRELPKGKTLAQWYGDHRAELRANALNRGLNAVVARALLPLFEAEPERWESMTWLCRRREHLRKKTLTFAEFLAEWRHHCPDRHKPFIRRLAERFGIPLPPFAPRPVGPPDSPQQLPR